MVSVERPPKNSARTPQEFSYGSLNVHADAMAEDQFEESHQAASFVQNGHLMQHRS
jgi:hypothetical protein